ncbi:MAG: right-handed parallel beta-helix repeat-containing protein [Patescibacteria group bacterium]
MRDTLLIKTLPGKRFGFTLLEAIFVIAACLLIAVAVGALIAFLATAVRSARQSNALAQSGALAVERLTREIRLALSVDRAASAFRTSPGVLVLNSFTSATDATPMVKTFSVVGGALILTEGAGVPLILTSSSTQVENFVLYPPPPPTSTVYYVRKNFSGCSDASDGHTPASAWCTIGKAAAVMTAGQTVYVGAGTYPETVTPLVSGTAVGPVSYIADVAGRWTGDAGPIVVDGGGTRCYGFDVSVGQSYLVIDGFEAINQIACGGASGPYTLRNGSNNIYRNLISHNAAEDGIILGGSANILENCLVYATADEGIEIESGGHTIRSCTFIEGGDPEVIDNNGHVNTYINNIIDGGLDSPGASVFSYSDWTDGVLAGAGNIKAAPIYVAPASNNYHLSQKLAGQGVNSPAVDKGSDTAANLGLSNRATRSDGVADNGVVDMGYHYMASSTDLLETAHSEWLPFSLTLRAGSGAKARRATFNGTAVLRGSY